ncbi:amino acid permease [Heliobacterium gestii]|uniref:Amino acid permease n=1 Tax=Heliomicrobium gestii TaxID=2699 RepID=A0A845L6N2_HELGE|nr:amino acid permease [Heliomicrobium gestii]MBM7866853.1 APA family basic amino acid/polyamine antiporter [Heliomicrobium gestii]MZP42282.1 amino acid permease [Heliomicrobium gestii]
MNLWRKKNLDQLIEFAQSKGSLKKTLGALDLTLLGIGAIIGTGIFVLTGIAAAEHAGPALVLSFVLAGLACGFAALAYAEFAALCPVSGSAYTYSYATLGEFMAWLIGWALILEYGLASSAVSIGWSAYFVKLVEGLGFHLPAAFVNPPATGGIVNLPAVVIVLIVTTLLSIGIRESARVNNIMVFIKMVVVFLFIGVGVWYVKPANWIPFMPYGVSGIWSGAAIVFFAYIGFDAVSTAAEEVKNPQRDLPIGIVASLAICTVLYIIVSAILTGIVPYDQFKGVSAPVALAMQVAGQNWLAGFVSVGAIAGITTVLLVMMFGQTRVFFAMSRDGLLPPLFSKVHPRFSTPFVSTWLTGFIVAFIAGFVPIGIVAEMVNLGTLSAFVFVSIGVILLRRQRPELNRPFRCPGVPFTPLLAVLFCAFLMGSLPWITWKLFLIWMAAGIVVYFLYGYSHSRIATPAGNQHSSES